MSNFEKNLHIEAKKIGFLDLDFPSCALQLKDHIDSQISTQVNEITLDIRWCPVTYSQANIFLDSCFKTDSNNISRLVILTTDNYITREMTCYQLFRTAIVTENISRTPKSVTDSLDEYCKKNDFSIEIKVYSGDTDENQSTELQTYFFPNKD